MQHNTINTIDENVTYGIGPHDFRIRYFYGRYVCHVSYGDRARGGDNGNSKTPSDQRKRKENITTLQRHDYFGEINHTRPSIINVEI